MLYFTIQYSTIRVSKGEGYSDFLYVPMYVNAQAGKGLEKEPALEEVIKKDFTFICFRCIHTDRQIHTWTQKAFTQYL